MTEQLKPCPFCGGAARIAVCDDEGNLQDESYENDPWCRLSYAITHSFIENEDCPISHFNDVTLGAMIYNSREELIKAWNTRKGDQMKEIKRYKLVATESAKNVIECDDGHWVHYSVVEQLQARIKELESDAHINEIKAQGIEWAVEQAAFDCVVTDDPVSVLEKVGNYTDELRGQNGSND